MKASIFAAVAGWTLSSWSQPSSYVEAAKTKTAFSQNEPRSYQLVAIQNESHDSKIFTFALPDKETMLNFDVPSCITLSYVDAEGKKVERPYTPLNLATDKGSFDILVKCYPHSKMGTHLHTMKKGDFIHAMGPWRTLEMTTGQYAHVGMLIGGTGITPIFQIIRNFLPDPENTTKFSMLFSNKTKDDILLGDELDAMARKYPDQFAVFYTLTNAPPRWTGYKGHITKDTIEETMPSPTREGDSKILVSGPPGFMKTICGEKQGFKQGPLAGILREMGYTENMVYKF